MNLRALTEWIQQEHYFEAKTREEAKPEDEREDPQDDVPERAWCERLARKHMKAARAAHGNNRRAFRDDLLSRVKKDKDTKGKKKRP